MNINPGRSMEADVGKSLFRFFSPTSDRRDEKVGWMNKLMEVCHCGTDDVSHVN